jgi:hypothetical protein
MAEVDVTIYANDPWNQGEHRVMPIRLFGRLPTIIVETAGIYGIRYAEGGMFRKFACDCDTVSFDSDIRIVVSPIIHPVFIQNGKLLLADLTLEINRCVTDVMAERDLPRPELEVELVVRLGFGIKLDANADPVREWP